MITLRTHLTFEMFQTLVNVYGKSKNKPLALELEGVLSSRLQKPVFDFLKEMRSSGLLKSVTSDYKHQSDFMDVWEGFITNRNYTFSPYNQSDSIIPNLLTPFFLHYINRVISGVSGDFEAYEDLVKKFDKGNFTLSDLSDELCNCNYCDKTLKLFADNWHIKTQVSDESGWEDSTNCEKNNLQEIEIDCPSGYLIVADWYRMPELEDVVREYVDLDNLGKQRSIIEAASILSQELELACIPIDHRIYGIYQHENELYFGKRLSHSILESFVEVGFITPEEWRISIIDKENFISAVERRLGYSSQERVDEFLCEDDVTAWNFIKVDPGRYKLSFYTDCSLYNAMLDPREKIPGLKQICSLVKVS